MVKNKYVKLFINRCNSSNTDSQRLEFVQLVEVIQLQLDDGIVRYVPGEETSMRHHKEFN